jgi:hypothetical protein
MSLEMAQKVIVPQKKIMSRSFLNSGTLIVIFFGGGGGGGWGLGGWGGGK